MSGTDRKAASGQAAAEADLAELIRAALAMADEMGLIAVGLRLDQALIDLTGKGSVPDMDADLLDDLAPPAGFHSPGDDGDREGARLL
jgi:hypothetical protein